MTTAFFRQGERDHDKEIQRDPQHAIDPRTNAISNDLPLQISNTRKINADAGFENAETPEGEVLVFGNHVDQQHAAG